MKKLLLMVGLLWSAVASAQFTPGQLLTAAELNTQFALYAPLAGATFTGPVFIPALTVTSSATFPAGTIALAGLAAQAANTVVANVTGSPATPTAVSLASCSTSASAVIYTSGTGFGCNTAVNAAQLGGATFASPGPIGSGTSSTGAFTALTATSSFTATGLVTLADVATQATNTILANGTASTASPTAIAIPSCSTSSSALNWTTSGGAASLSCNTAINAATLGGAALGTSGATVPLLNGANTWAGTQTFSSTITPSQTFGIVGTTTNNNANAGSVGETITNTTTATSLTNNILSNAVSVSLTAGDWDVEGVARFIGAAGTIATGEEAGVSTTSATLGGFGTFTLLSTTFVTASTSVLVTPATRVSLSATTTVYIPAVATFSGGTMTVDGFIRARRIR